MTEELREAVQKFEQLHKTDPLTSWLFLENNETVKTAASYLTRPVLANHITTLKNFAQTLVQEKRPKTNLITLNEQLILFYNSVKKSPWGKDAGKREKAIPLHFINELIGRYTFFRLHKIDLTKYIAEYITKNRIKPEKHETLNNIFKTYENSLGENSLDAISILTEALSILKEENPVKSAVIYHVTPANPLLQDLLDAVRGYSDNGKTSPHPNITEYPAPQYTIEKPAGITITALRYKTAKEEAEAVLDKIADLLETKQAEPEDILILHPGSAGAAEQLYQVLPDFYWRNPDKDNELTPIPVTPRTKYTLASLPSIQCVTAVLSAAENDFGLEDLQTIVGSQYLNSSRWTHTFEEDDNTFTLALTPGLFAQLSIVANVHSGKTEWKKVAKKLTVTKTDENGNEQTTTWDYGKFDAFIKPYSKNGTETTLLTELITWIENAAPGHIPSENKRPQKSYRTWASSLKKWLDSAGWTDKRCGINERAQKSFLEYLDTISGPLTGNETGTFADFVRHIRHFVSRKEIGLPDDKPEKCIRIAKIRSSADLSAKHVFIIGLTADVIPNIMHTLSPFTSDETYDLCPDLKPNQMKQEQANFAAALICAKEHLHLSCAAYSDSKNTVPSSFLTQLDEINDAGRITIRHSLWHNQITAGKILACSKTGSCEKLAGLTGKEETVTRAKKEITSDYNPDFSGDEVQAQFAKTFTKDNEMKSISPTQLETYLECPYKWYLKYHLKLYDPGEAMSEHSLKGTLIHKALESFIKADIDLTKEPDEAYKKLMECVEKEFAARYIDTPSWDAIQKGYMEEFDGRKNVFYRLLNDILIPLAKDGWKTGPELVEKKIDTEIELDGRRMKINGKIDCVMLKDDDICVIDYKTGTSFSTGKSNNRTVNKEKLQIPLYLSAYCTQEKMKNDTSLNPADGFYLLMTPSEVDSVRLIKDDMNSPEGEEKFMSEMLNKLTEAFDARDKMQNGICEIPQTCNDRYCPYSRFCRVEKKGGW